MAGIRFDHVSKVFPGGTRAVDDVSLEVHDGELMVLVGPSGCGKSTLMRMTAGLEDVTSGEIRIGDRAVNGLPPQRRDVAMVFQNYALYPHMTVRQNMAFPLKMAGMKRRDIRPRVERTAAMLGLDGLLDRKPAQLSGGQRQRIAMGRAIVREPAVFLMDEPLSNLDAKLRVQTRNEIARLQQRLGVTTLYVTHDQVEAMTMGERLAVLRDGRLQQIGPPDEVYARPANTFVAAFIGSPEMNLFRATPARMAGTDRLVIPFGNARLPLPAEYQASPLAIAPVIVGLRPEAFVTADSVPEPQRVTVTPDRIEHLGHELLAWFDVESAGGGAASRIVARLPASTGLVAGHAVPLGIEAARINLFDVESGDRLGG